MYHILESLNFLFLKHAPKSVRINVRPREELIVHIMIWPLNRYIPKCNGMYYANMMSDQSKFDLWQTVIILKILSYVIYCNVMEGVLIEDVRIDILCFVNQCLDFQFSPYGMLINLICETIPYSFANNILPRVGRKKLFCHAQLRLKGCPFG